MDTETVGTVTTTLVDTTTVDTVETVRERRKLDEGFVTW